jgi:peptide/nickel transport system substrate-binding protein
VTVLVAVAAVACGGDRGASSSGNLAPQAATDNQIRQTPRDDVEDGGTFTWPIDSMPPNFNTSQLDGTEVGINQVMGALMPSPFDIDAEGTPVWNRDLLASEPVVATDPVQVVTYRINPRAAWDDGTPITWEDFHWQWRANSGADKAYQIASANGYDVIDSVRRGADDKEVVVTYKRRYADWRATFSQVYPASTNRDPAVFN